MQQPPLKYFSGQSESTSQVFGVSSLHFKVTLVPSSKPIIPGFSFDGLLVNLLKVTIFEHTFDLVVGNFAVLRVSSFTNPGSYSKQQLSAQSLKFSQVIDKTRSEV